MPKNERVLRGRPVISTPSAPASGYGYIYPKSDGSWYSLDSSGVERAFALSSILDKIQVNSAGLTTSVTAYTAGDQLGSEITIAACSASGKSSVIQSATLVDKAKIVGAVDLFLFDRASSPAGDNAANSWADADMANLLGIIGFETPIASALNGIARGVSGLPLVVKGNSSVNIFGVLVTRVGHTFFGAVGDLVINLGLEQF